MSKHKALWMSRVARSKNYIILTDKEAIVNIRGVRPENINDRMMLEAQGSELRLWRDKLDALIKEFDSEARLATGVKKKVATKKRTTIKVK